MDGVNQLGNQSLCRPSKSKDTEANYSAKIRSYECSHILQNIFEPLHGKDFHSFIINYFLKKTTCVCVCVSKHKIQIVLFKYLLV